MNKFSIVCWTAADIADIKPDWTEDQCIEWLEMNEKYIRDVMIQRGWEYIEDMLED